jgi:hypothetical protein
VPRGSGSLPPALPRSFAVGGLGGARRSTRGPLPDPLHALPTLLFTAERRHTSGRAELSGGAQPSGGGPALSPPHTQTHTPYSSAGWLVNDAACGGWRVGLMQGGWLGGSSNQRGRPLRPGRRAAPTRDPPRGWGLSPRGSPISGATGAAHSPGCVRARVRTWPQARMVSGVGGAGWGAGGRGEGAQRAEPAKPQHMRPRQPTHLRNQPPPTPPQRPPVPHPFIEWQDAASPLPTQVRAACARHWVSRVLSLQSHAPCPVPWVHPAIACRCWTCPRDAYGGSMTRASAMGNAPGPLRRENNGSAVCASCVCASCVRMVVSHDAS